MDFDWSQIMVIILVGLFIFGPDKLPQAISDGLKFIRNIRMMAAHATSDLSRELGTDLKIEDLHPKTFIRKHVLSEEDQTLFREQAQNLRRQVNEVLREPLGAAESSPTIRGSGAESSQANKRPRRFDLDAT